jgi:outer membrane protein assembly factor BamA
LAAAAGGSGFGATLQGREPLGDHRWSVTGNWATGPAFSDQSASVSASYTWAGGPFDLTLGAGFRRYPNTQSLVAESRSIPFREHAYRGSVSLSYPLRRIDENLNLSTSFRVERTDFGTRPQTTPSPDDTQPSMPDFGWFNELGLSLSYIDLDQYPQSVSPEKGIYGRIGVSVQNEWIGSTYDQVYLNYSLHGYIPNPWIDRHTLALKLDGGIARSNYRGVAYGLGGYRPQDILTSIVFQRPAGQFVLRGFPPNTLTGNQFQRATAEYRFPIWRIESGPSTVPFFIDELKGEVFSDGGAAFDGLGSGADVRFSAGAELLLGLQIGYYFGSNLRVGYARGFGADGINEWYILYGGGF